MENGIDDVCGVQVVDVAEWTLARQLDRFGQVARRVHGDEGRAARTQAIVSAWISARLFGGAGRRRFEGGFIGAVVIGLLLGLCEELRWDRRHGDRSGSEPTDEEPQ